MGLKRLLVADDSATSRLLIAYTLGKDVAYEIIEAEDGTVAAEKIASEPVDLVITDIHMPGMNGLELVSLVRGMYGAELPLVVVTTEGEEEARDEGLARGADAYLTKPIRGPELTQLVQELLTEAEVATE